MTLKTFVRQEVLEQLDKFDNSISVQHEIHPEINFCYNSILLVIGKTGSGKTFNVNNELVALKYIPNDIIGVIYVSNNPNDMTIQKLRELIEIPVKTISYNESEDYIVNLRKYIQAYDRIKSEKLEDMLSEECKKDILSNLDLSDFERKNIYHVIIYDDAMNVFKKPNSKEFKMLFEYRHFKTTYILMMQSMKGLTTEIKAQIGGLWLFGGFNRQQFSYMFNQLSSPIEKERLWEIYYKLPKSCYLYLNYNSDNPTISVIDCEGRSHKIEED